MDDMPSQSSSLNQDLIQSLKDLLGEKGWTDDQEIISPHTSDWRGNFVGHSDFMVSPSTTEEVSEVMKLCHRYGQPVCPQGGNTGLVNGGIAYGEIVLSMARMNNVRSIDTFNNSLVAEAGCILANVHTAADEQERYFPLSLGSQGSCTIGGLISTNAGGVAVLRYGMMRDLLLGMEVVMANGEIWSTLRGLRKDNTGYDLKHLFCGAEGTLGIVTAATLKLFPKPKTATAWLTLETPQKAVELLSLVRKHAGDSVTGFEILPKVGVELAAREIDAVRDPLPNEAPWRILLEVSLASEDHAQDVLQTVLEKALEGSLITDGVVAASLSQAEMFWHVRESLPLVKRGFLTSVNHDISVPVSKVPQFLETTEAAMKEMVPDVEIFAFGHLGDGNIHYGVAERTDAENPTVKAKSLDITFKVHQIVTDLGGSISAEHGVGLLKRDELPDHKSETELNMMRSIKKALDPENLMNPGRVISVR